MPPKLAGPTLADVMDKLSEIQNSLDSLTSEFKSVKEKVQVHETQLNNIDASINYLNRSLQLPARRQSTLKPSLIMIMPHSACLNKGVVTTLSEFLV